MVKMRAAVWHGPGKDNFRLESIAIPDIKSGDVLLRVRNCFFCAMHARAIVVGHTKHHPPTIFGRMLAGDITAVGSAVSKIEVGMRVTVNPEQPCGNCFYCLRQNLNHCLNPTQLKPGGMAEFVCIPAALVPGIYELPPSIPYEYGAYTETLACALQGLDLANVKLSDCVVIVGDGGVGLTFLQLVQFRGASHVIFAGKHDDALQEALHLGAQRVVNITQESLMEVVMAETQGYGADVVIEAVGSSQTYEQALTLLRCGGTAVGFGGMPPGTVFQGDPNLIHYRSLKLIGSYRYSPEHFRQAISLICMGKIDLKPIVTHHITFDKLTMHAVDIHQKPDCRGLVIDIHHEP